MKRNKIELKEAIDDLAVQTKLLTGTIKPKTVSGVSVNNIEINTPYEFLLLYALEHYGISLFNRISAIQTEKNRLDKTIIGRIRGRNVAIWCKSLKAIRSLLFNTNACEFAKINQQHERCQVENAPYWHNQIVLWYTLVVAEGNKDVLKLIERQLNIAASTFSHRSFKDDSNINPKEIDLIIDHLSTLTNKSYKLEPINSDFYNALPTWQRRILTGFSKQKDVLTYSAIFKSEVTKTSS